MVNKINLIIVIFIVMVLSGCSAMRTAPSDEYLDENQSIKSDIDFVEQKFTNNNEEGNFLVEEYELNESYTLLNENNNSKNSMDEIFPIGGLIGYDKKYIYVIHYDEESTLISRINYIEKYIEKGIYIKSDRMIYSSHLTNNVLYIGEYEVKDNILLTSLKRISLEGNDFSKEEEIFYNEYSKFPEINYSEEYLTIGYVKDNNYIIGYINYDDDEFIEIYRSEFVINENHLYEGDVLLNANGMGDGIYFQIISLDNEQLDFEGTQRLYFYSFKDDKSITKLELSDKITYVKGNEDIIVINNYSVDNPREQTGKILSFKEGFYIDILETRAANSINNFLLKDRLLFITSYRNLYVYDFDKKSFESMKINPYSTEIKMHEGTFGFIETYEDRFNILETDEDKEPVFKLIKYKTD